MECIFVFKEIYFEIVFAVYFVFAVGRYKTKQS